MYVTPPERIDLDGFVLRRGEDDDAAMVAATVAANVERLAPWMPWASTSGTVEFQQQRMPKARDQWYQGVSYQYLAIHSETGSHLGNFGLERRIGPGALEIGYWLSAHAEGHGFAASAARVLTEVALALPDIHRVEIHVDEANSRSLLVPQRLGYRLDRVEPREITAPAEVGRRAIWVYPA